MIWRPGQSLSLLAALTAPLVLAGCGSLRAGAPATASATGTYRSDVAVEQDAKAYFAGQGAKVSNVLCAHEYANDYVCLIGPGAKVGLRVTDDGHAFVITPTAATASGGG